MRRAFRWIASACTGASVVLLAANGALAVPSFSRQLDIDCSECHTVFPELTPFGREFKLKGYTMSKSDASYQWPPPLAFMAQASYTHTHDAQPAGTIERNWATHLFASDNDIVSAPQQLSVFYAGRIFKNLGAFIQGTYDGAANQFFLDNTDIRLTATSTVWGKELTYGLTAHNNPTVQDLWNTTPAFSFPFASSSVAPTPTAAVLLDGGLAQQVGGIGAYLSFNKMVYLEGTVYGSANDGIFWPMGAGTPTTTVIDGSAPYWRAVLQHEEGPHSFSVGTTGLVAKVFAGGATSGPSDRFRDLGVDGQYQYISKKHVVTARAGWIHEKQDWDAGFPAGSTSNPSDVLKSLKVNATYLYRSPIGGLSGTAGYFSITGDTDPLLYADSRTGSPDSEGFILEADYLPVQWCKLAVQYTGYTKFNGSRTNFDGAGTNASANNTTYVLLWLLF